MNSGYTRVDFPQGKILTDYDLLEESNVLDIVKTRENSEKVTDINKSRKEVELQVFYKPIHFVERDCHDRGITR